MAHITGSGFLNVPRMSEKVSYEITLPPLKERPQSFQWLESLTDKSLTFHEKVQTFNMGIGMVLVCDAKKAPTILTHLKKNNYKAWKLGHTTRKKSRCEVVVSDENTMTKLVYS